ncbi:MAG: hypothetical protein MUP30_06175 [Deltaproteobacteria bacterium]|nr:hypothetical protein [Deltaproteobacteria bacterium]
MKKISLIVALFILVVGGCKEVSPEQRQREIDRTKFASKEYATAAKLADNNDPAGFLKLYEIAKNDDIYTAEYSEVATEELHYLLYSKTELWIKTFSKIDLDEFKSYIKASGIWVTELPKGVASDEQFEKEIFIKLRKIKGNKNEMELINYILRLYDRKSH